MTNQQNRRRDAQHVLCCYAQCQSGTDKDRHKLPSAFFSILQKTERLACIKGTMSHFMSLVSQSTACPHVHSRMSPSAPQTHTKTPSLSIENRSSSGWPVCESKTLEMWSSSSASRVCRSSWGDGRQHRTLHVVKRWCDNSLPAHA